MAAAWIASAIRLEVVQCLRVDAELRAGRGSFPLPNAGVRNSTSWPLPPCAQRQCDLGRARTGARPERRERLGQAGVDLLGHGSSSARHRPSRAPAFVLAWHQPDHHAKETPRKRVFCRPFAL